MLTLQRLAGNRAVVKLLDRLEAGPADQEGGVGHLAVGAWTYRMHPKFPVRMGDTAYAGPSVGPYPEFNVDTDGDEATVRRTEAHTAPWQVLATPENEDGYEMPFEHPRYPGYQVRIRVLPEVAARIAEAEQQHVDDLDTAWEITAVRARDAINQAAAEGPVEADNGPAAKRAMVDKVAGLMGPLGPMIRNGLESGGSLDTLGGMMDKAYHRSKAMRDDSGNHTIPVAEEPFSVTENPNVAVFDTEFVDLDQTPSSEVANLSALE